MLIGQNIHGPELTAEIAASQQTAIERIATIVQKHNIDCDFIRLPGYMFQGLPPNSSDFELDTLQSIYKAANDTHKLDISLVDDAEIKGFKSGRAIRYGNQATFHPTKYIKALAKVITEMGGEIYETTHMNDFEKGSGSGRTVTVTMSNGKKVKADDLVMATNVPSQKVSPAISLVQESY